MMFILDEYIPNPKCTLNYNKDYELLIATVLAAQCTDERVNEITKILFKKYNIFSLKDADLKDIENIIRPLGMTKKASYIIEIANRLVNDYDGIVPNNQEYLESLPGVGHKTANVVRANVFNEPTFAVDTHVTRVSKRLGIAYQNDDVNQIENKLMNFFPKDKWVRLHHQLLLFGRLYCKAKNPLCDGCKFKNICIEKKKQI